LEKMGRTDTYRKQKALGKPRQHHSQACRLEAPEHTTKSNSQVMAAQKVNPGNGFDYQGPIELVADAAIAALHASGINMCFASECKDRNLLIKGFKGLLGALGR
jgi:hypothetical protein